MKKTYFTLTGCNHYYGTDFIKKGMKLKQKKEPDNKYDKEAIQVKVKGFLPRCGKQRVVVCLVRTGEVAAVGESVYLVVVFDVLRGRQRHGASPGASGSADLTVGIYAVCVDHRPA